MLWPKKNSYKESDNEKKFLRLENSPPPPKKKTFLMVRPLRKSYGIQPTPFRASKLVIWSEDRYNRWQKSSELNDSSYLLLL